MSEPIDCAEATARLQDLLQNELTPELEAEIRSHVDRCRHCFTHYRFEENFFLMLQTRGVRDCCPERLRQRIVDLLRAEAQRG